MLEIHVHLGWLEYLNASFNNSSFIMRILSHNEIFIYRDIYNKDRFRE